MKAILIMMRKMKGRRHNLSIYTNNEIDKNLEILSGWETDYKTIYKNFLFANFIDATGFVLKVGFTAEKLDHHPDILLHSWNNVKINISTHSKNAITFKDFELAQIIEKISLSS